MFFFGIRQKAGFLSKQCLKRSSQAAAADALVMKARE